MKNLIEALQIFAKYLDTDYPTWCEHDILIIVGITYEEVFKEDRERLEELGFLYDDGRWYSYRYGSA